jgi:hypothetical protein
MSSTDSNGLEPHGTMEAWQGWFESRLGDERGWTEALLTQVVRDLLDDLNQRVEKVIIELRMAAKVQDGRDGRGLVLRGTWTEGVRYHALDAVALNGATFAAKCDYPPGPPPNESWQLVAQQGRRGPPGPKGDSGSRGRDGVAAPSIVGWGIDEKAYTVTPQFTDGTCGPVLDLRPLFQRFLDEADTR